MNETRTYRQLFRVAEFRALFLVQCLAVGAASIGGLALGTITYASTGSAVLTGLAVFGGPVIQLAASWFLSSAADLLRPRTALTLLAVVSCGTDALQTLPGLRWEVRFVLLALPWIGMAAAGGALTALVADVLPSDAFVFGRATMNIAVGVTQIVGFGSAGLLLAALSTSALFGIAAVAGAVAVVVVRLRIRDRAPRASDRRPVARSQRINTQLLRSRSLRPVLLALAVPNGLVVGCESLFIPFAGTHAGLLYATTATGMLIGDVTVGRFLPDRLRGRLIEPLRILLAAPYLLFLAHPGLLLAGAAGLVASVGYSASLPLQGRLVAHTDPGVRGQAFGLSTAGMLGMQGIGAAAAGAVAQWLGGGPAAASTAIGIMAIASLAVTLSLTRGLRRTAAAPSAAEAADV